MTWEKGATVKRSAKLQVTYLEMMDQMKSGLSPKASDKVLTNPLFSDRLWWDLHWILIENSCFGEGNLFEFVKVCFVYALKKHSITI